MSTSPRSFIARMAERRRRARLTSPETEATVALAEAQLNGVLENARPFRKGDRVVFRVEAVVPADRVEALLAALEGSLEPVVV